MIYGTGTDLVEVARIAQKLSNQAFLDLVFSPNEQKCLTESRAAESLAGKFAAKEAFFKALGTGISGNFDMLQVEVAHTPAGKPVLNLTGAVADYVKTQKIKYFHLSISHEKHYAVAVVILEK